MLPVSERSWDAPAKKTAPPFRELQSSSEKKGITFGQRGGVGFSQACAFEKIVKGLDSQTEETRTWEVTTKKKQRRWLCSCEKQEKESPNET